MPTLRYITWLSVKEFTLSYYNEDTYYLLTYHILVTKFLNSSTATQLRHGLGFPSVHLFDDGCCREARLAKSK